MITLYAWTILNKIDYRTAHKKFTEGLIPAKREGKNILIDQDFKLPEEDKISCQVCGKQLSKITASHVKSHNITLAQYVDLYPGPTISDAVSKRVSIGSQRSHSKDQVEKYHNTLKINHPEGLIPWNKGKTYKSKKDH